MNLVLDASVALAWCFEDEDAPVALLALDHLRRGEAVVPALWPLEVANGLLTAERRGRLDAAAAQRAARLLLSLPIAVEPLERSRPLLDVGPVARGCRLSVYDAAYLELAGRRGLPLASLDASLVRAARDRGVPILGE